MEFLDVVDDDAPSLVNNEGRDSPHDLTLACIFVDITSCIYCLKCIAINTLGDRDDMRAAYTRDVMMKYDRYVKNEKDLFVALVSRQRCQLHYRPP